MTKQTNKLDIYQLTVDRILAQLEAGVVPWHRPWASTAPRSMSTGKPYRGINTWILSTDDDAPGANWWGTYKFISAHGGQVRKGEKSRIATYWKMIDGKPDENGKIKKFPMLRYYRVFNATQVEWAEGIPAKYVATLQDHDSIAEAEAIVEGYKAQENAPSFSHGGDRACYIPSMDAIQLPVLGAFENAPAYYSTVFHEMTHSTGHASRCNREGVTNIAAFGSHSYGREELVAEMGAAILSGHAGIVDETLDNSASYIQSWMTTIKSTDNKLLIQAASAAQKAVDHILGTTWDNDEVE